MSATPETIIQMEAEKALKEVINRVKQLEDNDYFRPSLREYEYSYPPTVTELNDTLGLPASYNGSVLALASNTDRNNMWLIFGNASDWYYTKLHQAGEIPSGLQQSAIVKSYRIHPLTIPTNDRTTVSFSNDQYDHTLMHSTTLTDARFIARADAVYRISANVRWDNSASGKIRRLEITKNGTGILLGSVSQVPVDGFQTDQNISIEAYLEKDDWAQLVVFQDSGDDLDLLAEEEFFPHFTMSRVH